MPRGEKLFDNENQLQEQQSEKKGVCCQLLDTWVTRLDFQPLFLLM